MIRQQIQAVVKWLVRVISQPRHELDRWQRAVRFTYDLGRFGTRQLRHDRAPQMAAALAFHTLFGLFPVLVVATVLVKAMGMGDWLIEPLGELLTSMGLDSITVNLPGNAAVPAQTLNVWLQDRVREAEQMDMAAIGWAGFAVTAYAAIGLLVTIENSFNIIYLAPQGRPWIRRVPLYWFLLTLSPVALVLSTYLTGRVQASLEAIRLWPWVSGVGATAWSVTVAWLFMFTVYMLFPNTVVAVRPALAGALTVAIALEVGKWTLGAYLSNALSISRLYGSLGLIPLFMFWVYIMWLVVLFGLEVSAILQMLHGRRLEEIEQRQRKPGLIDPAAVLSVMEVVAERFQAARPSTTRQLAEATSIPEPIVAEMLERLEAAGLLLRLAGEEHTVSLAQPAEKVTADRLIRIGFEMADRMPVRRRSALHKQLRLAQIDVASRTTLATLAPAEACMDDS